MIKVKLNDYRHRYDIFQILNIFYVNEDIEFTEVHENLKIEIFEEYMCITKGSSVKKFIYPKIFRKKDEVKKILFDYLSNDMNLILPWGTMVGIRPTKLALNMLSQNKKDEEIIKVYKDKYEVSKEKAELCLEIAKVQKDIVNTNKRNIGIYIDMPFCPSRCYYCSFTSNNIKQCENLVMPYLNTLIYEIKKLREYVLKKELTISSIYFGGGTPTSVNDEQFKLIMEEIFNNLIRDFNVKEFTVECGRPDSINENKLLTMIKNKVSRISINPQTMNDSTLKLIGRNHTSLDIINKFKLSRQMGFKNINMDIIIGLMDEGIDEVKHTLELLKELDPDSITVHGLSVKRGSKLHEDIILNKDLHFQDKKEIDTMFKETLKFAKEMGLIPYYLYRQKNTENNLENIGFCKPNKECIYNIDMIEESQTIIGIGADAVTKVVFPEEDRIERFCNLKDVREYINRIDEKINKKEILLNTLYNE